MWNTRCAGKNTIASPLVCARPKYMRSICSAPLPIVMRSVNVRFASPLPLLSRKMLGGFGLGAADEFGRISFMFAAVFTCVTTSTSAGNSTLPLTWSPCVWVLTIIVTGLFVTFLIASSSGCPQPGFFVSTTTTPLAVMKTELLPPPASSSRRGCPSASLPRRCAAPAARRAAAERQRPSMTTRQSPPEGPVQSLSASCPPQPTDDSASGRCRVNWLPSDGDLYTGEPTCPGSCW